MTGKHRYWQDLTPAELGVLLSLADGDPLADIAAERHVSYQTVKTQAKNVYSKLGARNAAHAVALAYHRGLLVPTREGV